jgi:hypothetical protein
MDKSDMKYAFEFIEKKLKGQKNVTIMAHQNKRVWGVLTELFDSGKDMYVFNEERYHIKYNPSTPTLGNRSTTPEFVVKKVTKTSTFDADEAFAKQEITIRDWMGGIDSEKVKEIPLGENPFVAEGDIEDEVAEMVRVILINTNYNVMVQRQDTGDVTIWIDDKRFQQR